MHHQQGIFWKCKYRRGMCRSVTNGPRNTGAAFKCGIVVPSNKKNARDIHDFLSVSISSLRHSFSQDLLWYMSKEVEVTDGGSRKRKTFSFYAPLLLDAPPDLPVYPSQTSMLVRQHQRWRGLAGSTTIQPPTVEVIDADDLDL